MKVCIIGLGYIGLPAAAVMASNSHQVTGVDISKKVLDSIRKTYGPTEEPGLNELVKKVLDSGSLALSEKPVPSDIFILCLPTPIHEDKTADVSYVISGMKAITPFVAKGNLIILESTVPPGTTENIVGETLRTAGFDPLTDVDVAHAPEKILPGQLLHELVNLDRVMGGLTPQATERVKAFYSTFVKGKILATDATTAEFVKLIENSYRDVNIAFANELAILSEKLGINVWEAIEIANHHPRVNIHKPGPGVGGHCIAVDPYFLVEIGHGKAELMEQARAINAHMPEFVISRAEEILGELKGKKIGILGITYKANVGDCRESPALDIIRILGEKGATVMAHDSLATSSPVPLNSLEEVLNSAELLILVTDHSDYLTLDPTTLKAPERCVLDTRNVLDREKWVRANWKFHRLGDRKNHWQ